MECKLYCGILPEAPNGRENIGPFLSSVNSSAKTAVIWVAGFRKFLQVPDETETEISWPRPAEV